MSGGSSSPTTTPTCARTSGEFSSRTGRSKSSKTAQAALAHALANPPDLVLSDVMMPRMDGVALLRALRADPRTEAVPVVLLSARAGEEAVLEGIETGADDYLVKPFSARELVTRIRTHLGMARTQQRLQAQLVVADRMAVVGTLAAGVAHEINNPLSNVTANLDLIAEEVQVLTGDSPAGRLRDLGDMVNEARQGAERVRKIVRGMKTFARADEERRAQLDVQPVLELSINMTFHEIKHRARVVKDYGKVPLVEADEARLGQVFVNLLVNAAHATPQGHADQHEIRIVTGTDVSGRAIIEIRDTGLGMPPEVLRRVFDPFFTTRDIGQGTGLGLSICRNIVTALGGEIIAKSELGKGSTFRVVLPPAVLEVEEQREAPLRSRPPPAGRSGQVLVVEDDPMVGRTFRRVLGKEHEVTLVTDGKQALDLLVGRQVVRRDHLRPDDAEHDRDGPPCRALSRAAGDRRSHGLHDRRRVHAGRPGLSRLRPEYTLREAVPPAEPARARSKPRAVDPMPLTRARTDVDLRRNRQDARRPPGAPRDEIFAEEKVCSLGSLGGSWSPGGLVSPHGA